MSQPENRSAAYTYEWAIHDGGAGWWNVRRRYAGGSAWETVARVFGAKRAQIVCDALSEEAIEPPRHVHGDDVTYWCGGEHWR